MDVERERKREREAGYSCVLFAPQTMFTDVLSKV